MFQDLQEDYNAFFDYGLGAMCWRRRYAQRALYFLAPCHNALLRFEGAMILTMMDGTDWTHPGDVSGWDGNIERPTFHPSIWLGDRMGWHGFIQAGDLVDA